MPSFRYTGSPRQYPSLSLEVVDGDVVTLAKNPDKARFEPVESKKAPKKEAAK